MATADMPDEFFDLVAHHLPPEPTVGPHGGRPPIGHRVALRVIWLVLATGNRWEDVPPELGCSGRTAHRRLRAREEAGIWDRLHADLLRLLRKAGELELGTAIVDGVTVRAFGGGEATGPSPVGRRRRGTKHTVMVSRSGVPLAIRTAGANASDHTQTLPLVLGPPVVGGKPGRPKEPPDDLIAKRRTPHDSGLGKVRWVVERTIGWIKRLRRMRVRYDRLGVIIDAWTTLAACVVHFRILHHDTQIDCCRSLKVTPPVRGPLPARF